jgi:gas vesicle protein
MNDYDYEYDNRQMQEMNDATRHVLTGIVVGGLIGATAMMLLAPRSGEEMRTELKDKAMDLRDRATETVKDRVSQVASRAGHLTEGLRGRSQDIKHRGQDVLIEQLDRVAEAVEAAKKALQEL